MCTRLNNWLRGNGNKNEKGKAGRKSSPKGRIMERQERRICSRTKVEKCTRQKYLLKTYGNKTPQHLEEAVLRRPLSGSNANFQANSKHRGFYPIYNFLNVQ